MFCLGPGYVIKQNDAIALLKEVQADITAKKCKKPLLKLGTDGGHLVMRRGRRQVRQERDRGARLRGRQGQAGQDDMVNADPGDSTIDDAADDMARIKGTSAKDADDVDLNKKGSKAPIVLLAHGSPTSSLPGTVHATEFADKTPEQIVRFLVSDKKLDKNYAGMIYLDGCYTGAGPKKGRDAGELTNFAKAVYDEHAGNAATLKADVGIKLVRDEVDKLEVLRTAAAKKAADVKKEYEALKEKMAPEGDFRINDLVGVFGPEKLASKPWYKKLFG